MNNSWIHDGKFHLALGIEDTFVPQAKPGERPIDEYVLTEHDTRWSDDLKLAQDTGAKLVRWGIPWYLVQPEPDRWDWSWLDAVMARFGELELEPIVDLMHYGTPLWLEREFDHPDYPALVADYSQRIADRYQDVAHAFTPVNEPMIHSLFCGEYGYWPPYLTGASGLVRMALQISKGFVGAQRAIADVRGDGAAFVHVDAGMRYTGDIDAPEHREHATRLAEQIWLVEDLVTGKVDSSHQLAKFLLENGAPEGDLAEFVSNPIEPDVVGVNYYPRHSTEVFEAGVHHIGGFSDPRPSQDDGVTGLVELLTTAANRYGAPVMVTETCVTGSIEERAAWMDESIDAVATLRDNGMNVIGYTWWPLFDMYEWTYRHSGLPREAHRLDMGLYTLEETPSGLARVETPLVDRFRQHAQDPRHSRYQPSTTLYNLA